jgi:hypothetical protein
LCQSLSELDNLRKLILVDYDKVETKNIYNSIYRKSDVGKYKTTVLHDIIKDQSNIDIEILTTRYEEEKTKLPPSNLIIDCRDFVYNRKNEIDIRLYITSRYLVIDCRKNIVYDKNYEGRYTTILSKNDLRKATMIVTSFLQNGFINYMINNQIVKEISLDYLDEISSDIKKKYNSGNAIIDYESSKKLLNIEENIMNIIQENKNKNILINLDYGDIKYPIKKVPRNSIKTANDIISVLSHAIKKSEDSEKYYIVSITQNQNNYIINLLPETGAA